MIATLTWVVLIFFETKFIQAATDGDCKEMDWEQFENKQDKRKDNS